MLRGVISHTVNVGVKEEIRLPKENKDWKGDEDVHPVWLIKRK